ncbi:MAG: hypothetical protein ACO3MV_02040 [Flavobacteriales bacterium]
MIKSLSHRTFVLICIAFMVSLLGCSESPESVGREVIKALVEHDCDRLEELACASRKEEVAKKCSEDELKEWAAELTAREGDLTSLDLTEIRDHNKTPDGEEMKLYFGRSMDIELVLEEGVWKWTSID